MKDRSLSLPVAAVLVAAAIAGTWFGTRLRNSANEPAEPATTTTTEAPPPVVDIGTVDSRLDAAGCSGGTTDGRYGGPGLSRRVVTETDNAAECGAAIQDALRSLGFTDQQIAALPVEPNEAELSWIRAGVDQPNDLMLTRDDRWSVERSVTAAESLGGWLIFFEIVDQENAPLSPP